jgi:hypothetical protein
MRSHSSAEQAVEEGKDLLILEGRIANRNRFKLAKKSKPGAVENSCLRPEPRSGYVSRMSEAGTPHAHTDNSQEERKDVFPGARKTAHPERFCPNCSAELRESRCKLSCPQCGFYLSCSDFY